LLVQLHNQGFNDLEAGTLDAANLLHVAMSLE
jgi:hypothetical protein